MQLLGGSWVVRVTVLITQIKGLRTLLRTTHETPSIQASIFSCFGGVDARAGSFGTNSAVSPKALRAGPEATKGWIE